MILAVSELQNPPSPARAYRGRFAPSPTGPLHAGSLVAALGSWLDARAHQGQWLLRIEDIDTPRSIPGAAEQIQAQLLACGLQWDEEPVWQSARQETYQKAFNQLIDEGQLYPCNCSRQTIANALKALGVETERHQELVYPGSCRSQLGLKPENTLAAWRIALPEHCTIAFEDRALGHQIQNLSQEVGDFVLRRSDGLFTYQLAVVVDDAEQGITHVVRGEDLLNNTARQIYLQKVLHYPTPVYVHLPLVLDEFGEKLSKQTLASAIDISTPAHALKALELAANHLGLQEIAKQAHQSIGEFLSAATAAWKKKYC
ncbi:tRNA glutamyl-Q(34) synthetase GluQRS [Polynucleobacter paludilacus]|uniref:tRNA glutamyl-Q(34) synthetase GluQRS n=1 Tax=Polynucleobacter paludilacus TaxID=1855895 RepID=UPI001BFD7ED2|nr:tRNA glutamyl-Q(34) synthetase GluQRS [Polynucleobacter paludilacus]QWD87425.1 tRNA glutamyl-Q(34) synthetase GluQRS [Polynucleobacter paludilacus]